MGSSLPTKAGPSTAGTSNNFANTQLPAWFQSYWQGLLGEGTGLSNDLNYRTAGLTPDQITGSIATNNALDSWLSRPQIPAYDVFGMASTPPSLYGTGAYPSLSLLNNSPSPATAAQAQAAQAQAAQLNPSQISPFMSPYLNLAIDPTLNRQAQQQMDTQGRIAADSAAAGMYGGSRGAVASAIGDRDYRTQLAQTAGTMLNQGFNAASGLAQGNVANQQQTALANAGLQNAVNLANAQMQTGVSQSNAANANQRAISAGQAGAGLAGQQLQVASTTQQADADRFLRALAQQSQTDTASLQGTLDIARLLAQFGGQQQTTAQNSLNSYWQDIVNRLGLLKTGVSPGSSTATTGATTGTTAQPINLAQLGLGLAGLLSDPKDKTDVQHLGKEGGVDMYAYRYKGDPKSYPKVVGPMADDIERLMPGVTRMIAGHRVIKNG